MLVNEVHGDGQGCRLQRPDSERTGAAKDGWKKQRRATSKSRIAELSVSPEIKINIKEISGR